MDMLILSDKILFNEDDLIKYLIFPDIESITKVDLILKNQEDLFIILNLNIFESIFIGNKISQGEKCVMIKKIDPLLLLIKIIHCSSLKNSKHVSQGYKYMTFSDILLSYKEQVSNIEKDLIKANQVYIDNLIEFFLNKTFDLDKICDIDDTHIALNIDKCFEYLKNKIKSFASSDIIELVSIVTPYLPVFYHKKFYLFMEIDDKTYDEDKSIISNNSEKIKKVSSKPVYNKSNKEVKPLKEGPLTKFFLKK